MGQISRPQSDDSYFVLVFLQKIGFEPFMEVVYLQNVGDDLHDMTNAYFPRRIRKKYLSNAYVQGRIRKKCNYSEDAY